ncbi:hypothetical protein [Gracilibacillus ureilyticus]|uniref:hypothetical protein n=1 Tax=Gracilibacillus ureilyticus TaxID=531814 RepID=UPI0015872538|nr:hypothetical protein [Gracilibacillus ureilyticus]
MDNDVTRFMKTTTVSTDDRPGRDLGVHEVMELIDFFSEKVDHQQSLVSFMF